MTQRETADLLKAAAAQWLRYERQCMIVALERAPAGWHGVPDVVGINHTRTVCEIEVKCCMSDFRNNAKKRQIQGRAAGYVARPSQFYFLVPPELAAKVFLEIPAYAGLMTLEATGAEWIKSRFSALPMVRVVHKAPVDRGAKVLTVRELVGMVKDLSGTLVTALARIETMKMQATKPT